MIEYAKYRSRYASRIDPITRDRLDLGMSIEETIGYEAVYDHFILVRNLTDGIDLIEIINHLYKEYNAKLSVDHLTERHNDYMSLIVFMIKMTMRFLILGLFMMYLCSCMILKIKNSLLLMLMIYSNYM